MGDSFSHPRATRDRDVRAAHAADASGLRSVPDLVLRPDTEQEVSEILKEAARTGTPVTPQGLRSSTTGASVVERGAALSLERMSKLLWIDPKTRTARAEPGIVLSTFKDAVRDAGLLYPPDPTSEEECTLGGTVALNASGARSYKYGSTRPWVDAIRVVLPDGSAHEIRRRRVAKNASGYFGFQDPIDLWIGSEGTLGVITAIEVRLVKAPPRFFGAMAYFESLWDAIKFVQAADAARERGDLSPRCLEFFDRAALEVIRPLARHGSAVPEGAGACVFFEEECAPGAEDSAIGRWSDAIERAGGITEATVVALKEQDTKELRRLRHAVPAAMNERGTRARARGGRKVSTDWAVPLDALPAALADAFRISTEEFGGTVVAYGHAGSGHPHFNLIAEDPDELQRALRAARSMARRAVDAGGVITAEHGIGKVRRALLRELLPGWAIDAMRAVKGSIDPMGLLSPGNLLP